METILYFISNPLLFLLQWYLLDVLQELCKEQSMNTRSSNCFP